MKKIIRYINNIKKIDISLLKKSSQNNEKKLPFGINLIGVNNCCQDGKVFNSIIKTLRATKIPFCIILTDSNRKTKKFKLKYSINIFTFGIDEVKKLIQCENKTDWKLYYNVFIEISDLTKVINELEKMIIPVDEIWVPSQYHLNKYSDCNNIQYFPLYISANPSKHYNRKYFNIPERNFVLLSIYDKKINLEIDNPIGVIKAFKKAFRKEDKTVTFVIKIDSNDHECLEKIMKEFDGYENYIIIDKPLSNIQNDSLIEISDVYVSLAKGGDFNISLCKAMLLKTTVIANCYGALNENLTQQSACCVDYTMNYADDGDIAEPDIVQAAVFMKIMRSDMHYKKVITENAYNFASKKFQLENSTNAIISRVRKISDGWK